jgi:predicted RNase H-like nuclease (RuvC/YqgF family)
MDELNLNIEELKQLVLFYNKRASDSELKNAEFQLFINRLKSQNSNLKSAIEHQNSEIETLYNKIESLAPKKNKKPLTTKD